MIDKAIEIIHQELGNYLYARFRENENLEILITELMNQDGSPKSFNNDVVTITLLNLEEEKILRNNLPAPVHLKPIRLNIYLLFCSFYGESSTYIEALRTLSAVLSFFQANPILNHNNAPDMDPGIEKLILELENQNMQFLNYVWSMRGNRYIPSVTYKARMVVINEGILRDNPRAGVPGNFL